MFEKPLIISIESSSKICGVCLSSANKIIAEFENFAGNLHDKFLADCVQRILSDFDLSISDIDAVALSAGPGSFTGIRIGAAIAKSLCFNGQPKLISVPSFHAFASCIKKISNLIDYERIITIIPSHKNLLYYQIFDNDFSELTQPDIIEYEKLKLIVSLNDFVFSSENISVLNLKLVMVQQLRASNIALKAIEMFNKEQFTDAENFTPIYVQEFNPKTKK